MKPKATFISRRVPGTCRVDNYASWVRLVAHEIRERMPTATIDWDELHRLFTDGFGINQAVKVMINRQERAPHGQC